MFDGLGSQKRVLSPPESPLQLAFCGRRMVVPSPFPFPFRGFPILVLQKTDFSVVIHSRFARNFLSMDTKASWANRMF